MAMATERTAAPRGAPGFSLVEMLVALVVFSLGVLGLLNLSGESTRAAVAIEEHVLASVVAEALAVEAALADARALAGEAGGSEHAGGRDWPWTRRVSPTTDAALLRVDIQVLAPDGGRVVAGVSLFRSAAR